MTRREWAPMMEWLLAKVSALDYKPSTRWCFYQVMQKFSLGKGDYAGFKAVQSKFRKEQRGGWHPATLIDDSRKPLYAGFGVNNEEEFRASMARNAPSVSIWAKLDFYVEAWYEARAMTGQFESVIRNPYRITLRAFGGDTTIAPKWETAENIRSMSRAGRRVIILYFGDADAKGAQIPENAIRDIRPWARSPFEFHVGGLTVEQALEFGLPENFERPGQYQWEALGDDQARNIVEGTLHEHVDIGAIEAAIAQAQAEKAYWHRRAKEALGL